MHIIKCNINNFGCYNNKTFNFDSKLNSFCLNNGEGKTTLAAFIKAMFYSLDKSSNKSYERKHYKPYSGGEYGGSIEIKLNDKIYRIERSFGDSPSKDVLKIYDEYGNKLDSFLSYKVSSLQKEESSKLGEIIFGIDSFSFQKCNCISSKDLDFSSNESIKMKINNIVIDKEKENSYEDAYNLIQEYDLREKAPTRKNENAYPFMIKELEKKNKQNQNQINELNDLENNLKELYSQRDTINSELISIEEKQKKYSLININKGKLDVIKNFDLNIGKEKKNIEEIEKKYNNYLPSKEEINSLNNYVNEYEKYQNIDSSFKISAFEIEKLKSLKNHVLSDEDYTKLYNAYNIINENSIDNQSKKIDLEKYEILKNKFENKILKEDNILDKDYYECLSLIEFEKNNYQEEKEYPSENVLNHIENQIVEYNNLNLKLNEIKSSYKIKPFIVNLFLIIITLGIYFFVLNSKKKKYLKNVEEVNNKIKNIKNELDNFFLKYDQDFGTYEIRMNDLKNKIKKYNSLKEKDLENNNDKKFEIRLKENNLITYFSFFGIENISLQEAYSLYKKELKEYNDLNIKIKQNEDFNRNIEENKKKQNEIIDSILNKYNLTKKDDFLSQLNEEKSNLEFYKKYNPIYLNKIDNENIKLQCKEKIDSILSNYKKEENIDLLLFSKTLINDFNEYNNSKIKQAELIEEKNKYIKENNLGNFKIENINITEDELNKLREQKASELSSKEDEINQNETNISRREILQEEIKKNNELILNYKEKIDIARMTLKILEEAHLDMEKKFISPIKNSFIEYAKKIYEKIGSNVNMNYDYEIKYDVNGQLHDSKDLSDGEKTIMMFALKFAILDSMYKNHNSLIILDDPFDSLDSAKLKKAINLTKELSSDWQIIYFTCHESRKIDN